MDLRLPYPAAADSLSRHFGFIRGERHLATRHGNVVLAQDALGLILVNFHGDLMITWTWNPHYSMSLLPYLHRVADRQNLSSGEALEAMHIILNGHATPPQIAGFLVALRMKGETVDELVGFARALRQMAEPIDPALHGEPLLDTCGTGGDGLGTFNISTVAALVVAGRGGPGGT